MTQSIRIGGAVGFWGESSSAAAQLLKHGNVDILIFDYLAEVTLSIMARARAKDPSAGFATDFVTEVIAQNLATLQKSGTKIITNAGGVNPQSCADAIEALMQKQGIRLKVAVVTGDDLLPDIDRFAAATDMFDGRPLPRRERIVSMNAYLGAFPIAEALSAGADIVITGRCVDSALTLGACIHAFGWAHTDYDALAAGSLAGHLIECGPQATGGNFTDWEEAGQIEKIGYPIAEIDASGIFKIEKPADTEGLVTRDTVLEQLLYEIGDPAAYHLPDVVCDFTQVLVEEAGPNSVRVTGVKGGAPTGRYKVSATFTDGYRAGMTLNFNGRNARQKAQHYGEAVLRRAREKLQSLGAPDFSEVNLETFGGRPVETAYEEIVLTAAVKHNDARAVGLFLKELTGAALATPPGLHVFTAAGRPKPSPVVALFSFLVDREDVAVRIHVGADVMPHTPPGSEPTKAKVDAPQAAPGPRQSRDMEATDTVPLEALALARSGDKGDNANIGIIPRDPSFAPWIWQSLSEAAVHKNFGFRAGNRIERFYLPGTGTMNLVMHNALGGGGVASIRTDAQAKSYAQRLLSMDIAVPTALCARIEKGKS